VAWPWDWFAAVFPIFGVSIVAAATSTEASVIFCLAFSVEAALDVLTNVTAFWHSVLLNTFCFLRAIIVNLALDGLLTAGREGIANECWFAVAAERSSTVFA